MKRAAVLILVAVGVPTAFSCGRTDVGTGEEWKLVTDAGSGVEDASTEPDAGPQTPDTGSEPCEGSGVELCGNGIDEDCDGTPDDGCACNYDGQEAGVCRNGVIAEADGVCSTPDFYEFDESSCDGRDNDCDGGVDEGCTCAEGEEIECYNGPAESAGVGACAAGAVLCVDGVFGGMCTGEVVPVDETCDGTDDDCDGVVDEGCGCNYADSSEGVCAGAVLDEFGQCQVPAGYQDVEVSCDGLDNDCNGVADAGCACDYDDQPLGVCPSAVRSADGTCEAPTGYQAEETSCDGKDNDCDGTTDEGCSCSAGETKECYDGAAGTAGVGVCATGTLTCTNGMFGACEGQVVPGVEACDGVDDDCDGVIDEGCACNYDGKSDGVCASGLTTAEGACSAPPTYEATETTCDGLDNDCDGVIDEACPCAFGGVQRGVCVNGTVAQDGTCTAPPGYEAEETSCDGLNNDCDGGTDEGCPCDYAGGSLGICADAVRNGGGQCRPPGGYTRREANCGDGRDNDCNGIVDCDDPNCVGRGLCM